MKSFQRFDKAEIKAAIDCAAVLAHFGRSSIDGRFHCASPGHSDAKPSMTLCHEKAGVKCHSCGFGADAVGLFAALASLGFPQVLDAMGEAFHLSPSPGQVSRRFDARPAAPQNAVKTSIPKPAAKSPPQPKSEPCGPWRKVAEYLYSSPAGLPCLRVERMEQEAKKPDGSPDKFKSFPCYTREAGGDWVKGGGGAIQPAVLPYLWERLKTAPADGSGVVFLVEGEKDAGNLAAAGLYAVCVPGSQPSDWPGCGAGVLTSRQVAALGLLGCRVVVVPDADAAGWKKALSNLQVLCEVREAGGALALSIGFLDLGFPYGSKNDASDFLEMGNSEADLLALVEREGCDLDSMEWREDFAAVKGKWERLSAGDCHA